MPIVQPLPATSTLVIEEYMGYNPAAGMTRATTQIVLCCDL